jgi:signal transduction histidine kinase
MMRRSLQVELLATVLLAEALLAGGLLVVGRRSLKQQLINGMDSALTGRAMSVAALVRYSEDQSSTLVFDRGLAPKPLDARFPDAFEVLGPDLGVLGRSSYWPPELEPGTNQPSGFWTVRAGDHMLRGVRLDRVPILDAETGAPISSAGLTVVYATRTRAMNDRLASTTLSIGVVAVILVIMTGVFAAGLLRRSLSPLRELASAAESISAQQWKFEPPAEAAKLSELRPLVESLRTMVDGLHRSFDSQRDFIANAAHELKTPVAIQKSTLQLLLHHDLSAAEYKHGVQQALQDTQRLDSLLQRLLRLARAEQAAAGATSPDLRSVELSSSCEAALSQLQPYADSRGVALQLACDGVVYVKANPEDLVLIWSNLLENAIRHSPKDGTVLLKINTPSGHNVIVTVKDHGCGIDAEHQERIFERFYRGDESRARDTGGVGLGLAMVRTLVESYGGAVSVESAKGQGAAFMVTLPLR